MEIGKGKIVIPERIAQGEVIRAQAVVQHPMDTGFFRDANAEIIPAWFIQDVTVTYGDVEVAHFEWTSGVSRDPMIAFPLRADREGPLTLTYRDNRGVSYQITVPIVFQAG
jgi:sulfur-oxidizing protein SoxZ